jgi:hypothetical protein
MVGFKKKQCHRDAMIACQLTIAKVPQNNLSIKQFGKGDFALHNRNIKSLVHLQSTRWKHTIPWVFMK